MADGTTSRVLPHNLEAERSVLGAILIENEALNEATAVLTSGEFYRDAHKRIFARMVELSDKHQPIEIITIKEALERKGELEEVGGPAYIASLVDGVPRSTNVEYYARIVKEKATLRNLIYSASKILTDAYEAGEDADLIVDRAEQLVMDVGKSAVKGDFILADEWMRRVSAKFIKAHEERRVVTGIPSGFDDIDMMTRGWQPADLIFLGAQPSSGKTALMLQMALNASHAYMVGVVSIEMSADVLGQRAVAVEAGLNAFDLMTGLLSSAQQTRAQTAFDAISSRHIAIDDCIGMTATQMRAKVRRFAARHGLDILFIDYMQLLHESGNHENRNLELAKISVGLKQLARELNIPVFVLSQLTQSSARENRRPAMHDLRDSGALRQDADVVLLLWRPQQHADDAKYADGEEAEVIIGKQRNGPVGARRLQWVGNQMKFGSLRASQPEEPKQEAML